MNNKPTIIISLGEYINLLTPDHRFCEYAVIDAAQYASITSIAGHEQFIHIEQCGAVYKLWRLKTWQASTERQRRLKATIAVEMQQANRQAEAANAIYVLFMQHKPEFVAKHGEAVVKQLIHDYMHELCSEVMKNKLDNLLAKWQFNLKLFLQ